MHPAKQVTTTLGLNSTGSHIPTHLSSELPRSKVYWEVNKLAVCGYLNKRNFS